MNKKQKKSASRILAFLLSFAMVVTTFWGDYSLAFAAEDEIETTVEQEETLVEEVQEVKEESVVFEVVEQMPSFPGGEKALMEFLSKNTKYPSVAEENGIQGRVVCTFVVETNGSITDVKVVRAVDPALDREAVRVIKSMPKWIPGKQNGKAVRVKYTVPVNFKLQ